ncbi:Glucosamine-phosphate N-acetyltransferase-like protein [Ascosphaera acerosa]|nr:Glucosamine-phosphate N-acetyltransferase-like protein [Ascosphaera acerosa]
MVAESEPTHTQQAAQDIPAKMPSTHSQPLKSSQTTTAETPAEPQGTTSTTPTPMEPAALPADAHEPLFSSTYLSPEVQAALPEGYTLRPLCRADYFNSYLDVLRVLTTVGDVSWAGWSERYDFLTSRVGEYFPIVICDGTGKIVGTGSVLVERKFIHSLGAVGHIEDIAVDTHQQGKKLGLRLIQALTFIAQKAGCYKTILDCSEHNEGFYLKCGYKRAGLEMAHYY